MTEAIEWGEPIPTNGVLPAWLRREKFIPVSDGEDWDEPYDVNGIFPSMWREIDAIRLPTDHAHYARTEPASLPNGWTKRAAMKRRCELTDAMLDKHRQWATPHECIEMAFDLLIAQHETPPVDPREAMIRECAQTAAGHDALATATAECAIRIFIEKDRIDG